MEGKPHNELSGLKNHEICQDSFQIIEIIVYNISSITKTIHNPKSNNVTPEVTFYLCLVFLQTLQLSLTGKNMLIPLQIKIIHLIAPNLDI